MQRLMRAFSRVLTLVPTQPKCFGETGKIDASATGGTGTILYSFNGGDFGADCVLERLAAATYTVVAKDANGCTDTNTATIDAAPSAVVASATPTAPQCNGGTDGSSAHLPRAAPRTITYSKDGVTFQASGLFSGLPAGDYTITAKDSHGCLGTKAVTITQPTAVVASATPTALQCNGALTVPSAHLLGRHRDDHLLEGRSDLPGLGPLQWPACWRLYDHGERFTRLPRDQGGDDHTADSCRGQRGRHCAAMQRRH